jgi:hypothetical protein
MKNSATLREAFQQLQRLIVDSDLFAEEENAQQFVLGALAAIAWTTGENQSFADLLSCARRRQGEPPGEHCARPLADSPRRMP